MTSRIPSLNWLRVFEAAARTQSFARAAEQLNMSAAAVSQQVKALEGHLGSALFQRHAHAVSLTEAGRAYLPSVQQSLLMLGNATDGLFGSHPDQPLFVQSVLLFAHGVLAKGLPDFSALHPRVALTLSTGNSVMDFANSFTDLKIVFGNPSAYGEQSDTLIGEHLYPVAMPQVAAQIAQPQDVQNFPLIEVATHRAGWLHVFEHLNLGGAGARMIYADNTIMATALAAHQNGIALARAPASDLAVQSLGLVPCLPDVSVPGRENYHLVYPDRAALRPAAAQFRDWIIDYCR